MADTELKPNRYGRRCSSHPDGDCDFSGRYHCGENPPPYRIRLCRLCGERLPKDRDSFRCERCDGVVAAHPDPSFEEWLDKVLDYREEKTEKYTTREE